MRLRAANGTEMWLGYGMNVHPGGAAATTLAAIDTTLTPLRERLAYDGPLGIAVRWSAAGVEELKADADLRGHLRARLDENRLVPFTGNAFVYGDFHGKPLKDDVYRPAWDDPARTAYTLGFAEVLASLVAEGSELTLSTAPCAWRGWPAVETRQAGCAEQLVACARGLRRLFEVSGVAVRLGIEPEPRCTIETTAELCAFFAGPLAAALAEDDDLRSWLGICYDVCHQAVVHEEIDAAIDALAHDRIEVVKMQASCALEVEDPEDAGARAALARFDEPVYLHQVGAPDATGCVHMAEDLPDVLGEEAGEWLSRRPWRSHFHVPVFRARAVGPLRTTQPQLERALRRAATGELTRQVEIETYTWDVIPTEEREAGSGFDLVEALAREYEWVLGVLASEGVVPLASGDSV